MDIVRTDNWKTVHFPPVPLGGGGDARHKNAQGKIYLRLSSTTTYSLVSATHARQKPNTDLNQIGNEDDATKRRNAIME